MYTLELVVTEPKTDAWGEFEVRKTYLVTNERGISDGIYGVVVQKVVKTMDVTAGKKGSFEKVISRNLDDGGNAIARFTNKQVLNASGTYYELFPILNGTTCMGGPPIVPSRRNCIDDQFQNGAILNYEYDKKEKAYFANDDPPTTGTIAMVGQNVFYETDQKTAEALYNAIQKPGGDTIDAIGKTWSLSTDTPANGLPYRKDFPGFEGGSSAVVTHKVIVKWDVKSKGKTTVTSTVGGKTGGKRRRKSTRGRAASKSYRTRRTGTSRVR